MQAVFKGKDRTGLVARFDGLPLWITPWESYTGCLSRAGFKQAIRRFGHYINAQMVEVKPLNAINEFHIAETVICVFCFLDGYTVLPSRTIPDEKHKNCLFSLHLQRGLQNPCYQPPVKVIANKLQKYRFCTFSNDPQEIRNLLANTEQITAYKEYLIRGDRGK